MNVRVMFDVQAETLPDAIVQAHHVLATFLDVEDTDAWYISLTCRPEPVDGLARHHLWTIDVEATRGVRHGP